MPRPCRCRRVRCCSDTNYFKPRGIPADTLEEVNLTLDELEAVRLADFQGLYQEDAARLMDISRQTFGNIINSAHRKIADALLNAKALKISGGAVKQIVTSKKGAENEDMHTDRNQRRVERQGIRPFRKRAFLYRV